MPPAHEQLSKRIQARTGLESAEALVDHAQRLLERLLKCAANGHGFADALHRRAKLAAHARELLQIPARNLQQDGA